jgi:hypothetical protein
MMETVHICWPKPWFDDEDGDDVGGRCGGEIIGCGGKASISIGKFIWRR